MDNQLTDVKCILCDDLFRSYFEGRLCWECRRANGAYSKKDVSELEDQVTSLSPADRASMKEVALGKRGRTSSAPAVVVDRAKVAEAVRTMVEYGRLVHDTTPITQPTSYVIAKSGLFEVRHTDIADVILQPKVVLGVEDDLTPGVRLNVPKVPFELLSQTVAFFRETCRRQNGSSEALVQVWWNLQEKRYELHVPDQRVSGGGVHHESAFDRDGARAEGGGAMWLHVIDIHSHGSSMGAFWSGTDDSDERRAPEGRMFGVIGKVLLPMPEWRWRMRTREGFIDLSVGDVFALEAEEEVPFHVRWDVLLNAASHKDGVDDRGNVLLRCPVDAFKDATCPEEWHGRVVSSFGGGRGVQHSHAGAGWVGGQVVGRQSTVIPSYIYIKSADGRLLEEFEIDMQGTPKSTGHSIALPRSLQHGN